MVESETFHPLDEVIWRSLTSVQAPIARGDDHARRYPPQVAPFAAPADFTARSFQSLRELMERDGDLIALFTPEEISPPVQFSVVRRERVDQMVLVHRHACKSRTEKGIEELTEASVPAMRALAEATKPGPFGPRTIELGRYIGIRHKGTLIAMAGERMRLAGFTEISAVCVDPAHRGRGLAAAMIGVLVEAILARSETPFLHAFSSNTAAIALYRGLGFALSRQVHLAVLGVGRE